MPVAHPNPALAFREFGVGLQAFLLGTPAMVAHNQQTWNEDRH
jgi:hypothetical protein